MSTIIDTHTHLYDIQDLAQALSLSSESGVSDVVALGVDYLSNIKHLELGGYTLNSPTSLKIHLALGIHPGNITPEDAEKCLLLFRDACRGIPCGCPKIVAIGEIGLDFWYKWVRRDDVKKDEQRRVFQAQLDLAKEFDLPVVVHSRGTWRECLDRLKTTGIKKANFHWYSGPLDVLQDILDQGYMISVTPALEYSVDARRAGEYAPLEQIMVETDTPVKLGGHTLNSNNELSVCPPNSRVPSIPKDVWRTFDALCALKKTSRDKTLEIVNTNARTFFNI